MGIITLLFLPLSIVFAIVSVMVRKKPSDVFAVCSFVFCAIPPIGSIFDINKRAVQNDMVGIRDIYPTLGIIFVIVFMIVTLIQVIRVSRRK